METAGASSKIARLVHQHLQGELMLFHSYEFILVFLPITFFLHFYLNSKRLTETSKGFLIFSSLFFYGWWSIAYLPILIFSIIFNYFIGRSLTEEAEEKNGKFSKKLILILGVTTNVALLAYFKYMDFFIENINLGTGSQIDPLNLLLPLAISFFTFQQIAYLIDSYREKLESYGFLNYAVFVAFFPQLIAGPIVHYSEMMPQFANTKNKTINYKNISMGLLIFSIGLFKKVVIADTFAVWATGGFDTANTLNLFAAWTTSLSYTFQLYFDFSGYADMAIGLALLFNIMLPINFNSPYQATDIQDFWRRWHMTLCRFLKDYIYIPLGGNRKGDSRTYSNLMITFLLAGIWHGAGWLFIFWGGLHGAALVIHRIWSKLGFKLATWLAWLITFNFINISWIFFRAKEWDDAIKVLSGMFGLGGIVFPSALKFKLSFLSEFGVEFGGFIGHIGGHFFTPIWLIISFALILAFKNSTQRLEVFRSNYSYLLFNILLLLVSYLYLGQYTEFLYFNF
jgi:alginate O-acetyltransferase complex protein AlgI